MESAADTVEKPQKSFPQFLRYTQPMNKKINKLKQLLTHQAMAELTIEYNASFNAKEQQLLLKAWLDNIVNTSIMADKPNPPLIATIK